MDCPQCHKAIDGIAVKEFSTGWCRLDIHHDCLPLHHSDNQRQVDLKQRREQLKDKLTTLMHRLPDADVAEILRRYPMVGTL